MCLEDPTDHGRKEDGSAEWEEIFFPANSDDVFSNIDYEDFGESSESEL